MRTPRAAYPVTWRVMDMLERLAAAVWPSSFQRGLPYLMLLPAIVLVGLLVLGLVQIGDTSLRVLDTSTFLMSEDYTLANYQRVLTENFFATVAGRSPPSRWSCRRALGARRTTSAVGAAITRSGR